MMYDVLIEDDSYRTMCCQLENAFLVDDGGLEIEFS